MTKIERELSLSTCIKEKCLSVCLSRLEGGMAEETGRVGQWAGGGISKVEYLGGHTFPKQRRVTQVVNRIDQYREIYTDATFPKAG